MFTFCAFYLLIVAPRQPEVNVCANLDHLSGANSTRSNVQAVDVCGEMKAAGVAGRGGTLLLLLLSLYSMGMKEWT